MCFLSGYLKLCIGGRGRGDHCPSQTVRPSIDIIIILRMLLDEVVSSTVQRCIDPVLMEPKVSVNVQSCMNNYSCFILQVIEVICERN